MSYLSLKRKLIDNEFKLRGECCRDYIVFSVSGSDLNHRLVASRILGSFCKEHVAGVCENVILVSYLILSIRGENTYKGNISYGV